MPKNAENLYCDICHFRCSKQSNFATHLGTLKHKRLINPNKKNAENENAASFICVCGKSYKHMSSLCKHKRTCAEISPTTESAIDNNFLTNLVLEVIKNNNFQITFKSNFFIVKKIK